MLCALTWMASCGDGVAAPNCPVDLLPVTCPTPAPTFAADANPIFQAHCVPCHSAVGVERTFPFETYMEITKPRVPPDIINQVNTCRMPPVGALPVTDEERRTLLGWFVCGALND
jgi:uncharacterized membrane protein